MESKNSWRVFGITFLIIACVLALAVIRPSLSAAELGSVGLGHWPDRRTFDRLTH
jgi:hypothetical protein